MKRALQLDGFKSMNVGHLLYPFHSCTAGFPCRSRPKTQNQFSRVYSYLLNNSGEDGGFVSVLRTLTNPPTPFFEKIRLFPQNEEFGAPLFTLWWEENKKMLSCC